MKVRAVDEHGYPIDYAALRFKKPLTVAAIPKPDESLHLATRTGGPFAAKVTRVDWHEERGLFVVTCQFGSRSISAGEYAALMADPDWQMKPLI